MKYILTLIIIFVSVTSWAGSMVFPASPGSSEPFLIFSDSSTGSIAWMLFDENQNKISISNSIVPEGSDLRGEMCISKLNNGSIVFKKGISSNDKILLIYKVLDENGAETGKGEATISPVNCYAEKYKCNTTYNGVSTKNISERLMFFYKDESPADSTMGLGVQYEEGNGVYPKSAVITVAKYNGDVINLSALNKHNNNIISCSGNAMKLRLSEKRINTENGQISCYYSKIGVLSLLNTTPGVICFEISYSDGSKTTMMIFKLGSLSFDRECSKEEGQRIENM